MCNVSDKAWPVIDQMEAKTNVGKLENMAAQLIAIPIQISIK